MTADYNLHSLTGEEEELILKVTTYIFRVTTGYIFRVTTGHMKKPLLGIQKDNQNVRYHRVILSCMNLLYI